MHLLDRDTNFLSSKPVKTWYSHLVLLNHQLRDNIIVVLNISNVLLNCYCLATQVTVYYLCTKFVKSREFLRLDFQHVIQNGTGHKWLTRVCIEILSTLSVSAYHFTHIILLQVLKSWNLKKPRAYNPTLTVGDNMSVDGWHEKPQLYF